MTVKLSKATRINGALMVAGEIVSNLPSAFESSLILSGAAAQIPQPANIGGVVPGMSAHAIQVSPAVAVAGSAATYGWQHFAEDSFNGVRFVLRNYGAGTLAVNAMKCAPSPTHLNDGSALTWTAVTFGGSSSGTIPAGSGSGVNAVPGLLFSDVINIKSLVRTDSPLYKPLLQTRVYLAASATVQNESSTLKPLADFNTRSNGRQLGAWIQSGDHVSSIAAKTMLETGGYWSAGVSAEFYYSTPTISICAAGDSLFKGANSSAYCLGMIQRAAMILTDTYKIPCSASVYALSGQTTTGTLATVKSIVAAGLRPNFMILKNWSPNDTSASDAIMEAAKQRLLEEIAICRAPGVNITPIIVTSPPNGTTSSTARLVAHNLWTMSLKEKIANIAPGMEDPRNPGELLPLFDAGDRLHYSNEGHDYGGNGIASTVFSCLAH